MHFLNSNTVMRAAVGSPKKRRSEIRSSKHLPDLQGLRIGCCSRSFKRSALLFDVLTTSFTLFERESEDYEAPPDWVCAYDAKVIQKARRLTGVEFLHHLPETFDLSTYQAVARDTLLTEVARVCRAQGADAAVVDLVHPQVLQLDTGNSWGLSAALASVPVAIESELSWEQVREFRNDEESRRRYRDLHMWLTYGLKATSRQHAIDVIGQKLEDYEWSLRKHGIVTSLEVISALLAAGTVVPTAGGAVAAAARIDDLLATILGGGLAVAGITAWVAKRLVDRKDLRRGQNREIAYIYDLQKLC